MAHKVNLGSGVIHAGVRDRSRESWVFRSGNHRDSVKPKSVDTLDTLARPPKLMNFSGDEIEYSDGSDEERKRRIQKRNSLDRKLLKMDQTIRGFTCHLSQIDSTLGQMKSFGSIGQYLDTVCKNSSDVLTSNLPFQRPFRPLPVKSTSSESDSSSESGKSFECCPPDSYQPRDSRHSSSLGTSLTTLPSSLWSSLSPNVRDATKRPSLSEKRPSFATRPRGPSEIRTGGFRLAVDVDSSSSSFTPSPLRSSSASRRRLSSSRSKSGLPMAFSTSSRKSSLFPAEEKSDSGSQSSCSSREREDQFYLPRQSHRNSYSVQQPPSRKSSVRTSRRLHVSSPDLNAPDGRKSSFRGHRASVPLTHSRSKLSVSPPSSTSSVDERSDSLERLTQRLFRLVRTERDADARRLIGNLLVDSYSRSQLSNLITSLSSRAQNLSENGNIYENTRSNSLLQLAESLAALADRQYRSRASLTTNSRTPGSDYATSHSNVSVMRQRDRRPSGVSASSAIQFVEWPVDAPTEERVPPMKPKPPPAPPTLSKSAIILPEDALRDLDSKALAVAEGTHIYFSNLVEQLIEDLTDEVSIVRVLFSWLVSHDLKMKEFDPRAPSESLPGSLRRVQAGQMMYNEVMHKLCRFAGIHCQLVTGYSKGTGYRPGMPLKNNQLFHSAWLAVHVGGGWRFLNVDMAMRPFRDGKSASNNRRESVSDSVESKSPANFCDEFYFLADPDQYIFISFPDQKAWQLLPKPISMDRFIHLPLLRSAFFNACLSLKKNYGDCLITSHGQVTLKLLMPRFVGVSCSLENSSDHSVLHGLCLVEVLSSADVVRVQAAPSQPGKYYLHIFVAPDWRQETVRELACSFQIHCSEHNYERLVTMGRVPELGFLGPTPEANRFGISLHARNRQGRAFFVHNSIEPFKLRFAIPPGLKVCHQLKSFDRPGHQMVDCDCYALLQTRSSAKSTKTATGPNACYTIRTPVEGFYYLTVYASANSDLESDHLECVYRILIDVRRAPPPATVHAFPRQTYWWVQCRLYEPLVQRLKVNRIYSFRLDAPQCDSVAVVLNDNEWVFLACTDSVTWTGKVNVGGYLGQVSVFGRFRSPIEDFHERTESEQADSYVKLLDYVVVE